MDHDGSHYHCFCYGSKEVGGPQAASAIAMRVQAKKVAAGILETGGVDEERMDVD